jgi:transcription elongation GreA/GreB family factor
MWGNIEKTRAEARKGKIILASALGLTLLEEKIIQLNGQIKNLQLEMGDAANNDKDLRENPGFMERRTQLQTYFPRELARMRSLLARAVISEEHLDSQICFGDIFSCLVKYPDQRPTYEYFHLLGPIETECLGTTFNDNTVISYLSPIGSGLWGTEIVGNQTSVNITPSRGVAIEISRFSKVRD